MCDCLGDDSLTPDQADVVNEVHGAIDKHTSSMLKDVRDRVVEQKEANNGEFDISILNETVSAITRDNNDKVALNCIDVSSASTADKKRYAIPQIDEYYGDLSFWDNLCYFGKYSDGMLGSSFDDDGDTQSKTIWNEVFGNVTDDILGAARKYFQGMIGTPVYGVDDIFSNSQNVEEDDPNNSNVKKILLNEWEIIDIANIGNKDDVIRQLLASDFDGDTSDMWLTLIAFIGYGAHRTSVYKPDNDHPNGYFVNDVTFINQYEVRKGFEKYGAAAYFDDKFQLRDIYLSKDNKIYRRPNEQDGGSRANEWKAAKWAWKVSLSVTVFLVDYLSHLRFRESTGYINAIRDNLPPNDPIRRLLVPFTLGTVYANRVHNEYLRENGLYHRAFAFTYPELQRLVRDSVADAPPTEKTKDNKGKTIRVKRKTKDLMKYRFRLFKKKLSVLAKLPGQIYAISEDASQLWQDTLNFLTEFVSHYYGDNDDALQGLPIAKFYQDLLKNINLDPARYRLKGYNIAALITHYICMVTAYNKHLNGAVSFHYSIDPDFTGLKIVGGGSKENTVQSYVEYCTVVLSKGYQFNNLLHLPDIDNNVPPDVSLWSNLLPNDNNNKREKGQKIMNEYFKTHLGATKTVIKKKNKTKRIAAYNSMNPDYCQISCSL